MTDNRPDWSDAFADQLLGSLVLVGLTRQTASGDTQEQFFGTVAHADASGITLSLGGSRDGQTLDLPPDTSAFHTAAPGLYRLHSTGETVEDPDFTATWTILSNEG